MALDLGNLLQKYLNPSNAPSADASAHFDQVAQHASPEVVSQGIADALRSDETPPLGQLVSDMFSRANPQQQAGMLNQILSSLGPGALSSLGAGALGGLAGTLGGGTQITPQQASQLSPQQVQDIATHAEQTNPSIFDKLGNFYAQHPQLVKTLGSAAMTIALAKMANRMRS
ncbi:MAG TPA: hypothetical protein VFN86_07750 [Casimicrobiaceae bacterium]|jgi:hypothetical protein|nr:hypothetical protein [Casimicrobiaceae bacterium]